MEDFLLCGLHEPRFQQITRSQREELAAREAPDHPQRISRQALQTFLEGREPPADWTAQLDGEVTSVERQLQALISAGCHRLVTDGDGNEVSAKAYRRLWPWNITVPIGVDQEMYPHVLLVDTSANLQHLRNRARVEWPRSESGDRNINHLVSLPRTDWDKKAVRYIAFVQCGPRYRGEENDPFQEVEENTPGPVDPDEVSLTLLEALFLRIQFPRLLQDIDILIKGTTIRGYKLVLQITAPDQPARLRLTIGGDRALKPVHLATRNTQVIC